MAVSADILRALQQRHPSDHWLLVDEVRLPGAIHDQRIDAVAMSYWPSEQHVRHAYEVKVSRGDFLRELAAPRKRAYALEHSEFFWFALAPGVAALDEVPQECGAMELQGEEMVVLRPAPRRAAAAASLPFMLALSRRASAAGRREAALQTGLPCEEAFNRVLEGLVAPGMLSPALEARMMQLSSSLRRAGHASFASTIDRHRRQGVGYRDQYARASMEVTLERLAAQNPLPAACPQCGGANMERHPLNVLRMLCGGCGHQDGLALAAPRRRRPSR